MKQSKTTTLISKERTATDADDGTITTLMNTMLANETASAIGVDS